MGPITFDAAGSGMSLLDTYCYRIGTRSLYPKCQQPDSVLQLPPSLCSSYEPCKEGVPGSQCMASLFTLGEVPFITAMASDGIYLSAKEQDLFPS